MREDNGTDHVGGPGDEDPHAITVEPGDTGELTDPFDETGTIETGYDQEGHYAAGTKISVEVA